MLASSSRHGHRARVACALVALVFPVWSWPGPAAALPAAPVEVQVSSANFADIEFDSARTGNYCPTCNYGAGNSRVTFVDNNNVLWVGGVDFQTGAFVPADGRGTMVDTNAAFLTDFGNGPTWSISAAGSMLVYTRYADGQPQSPDTAGIGLAQPTPAGWSAGLIPGTMQRASPKSTTDITAPFARISYGNSIKGDESTYWMDLNGSATEVKMPVTDPNRGLALRWVDGTHKLIYVEPAAPDANGQVWRQVFLYDTDALTLEQLTSDPVDKRSAFMWSAPEFGGAMVFFVIAGTSTADRFDLYRHALNGSGGTTWMKYQSITTPAKEPFISGSPEAFAHNGQSWIVLSLCATSGFTSASTDIAIASIDPKRPVLRQLTNALSPNRWRADPEYFVTAKGPFIYYTRSYPGTTTRPPISEGIFYVDTGLGPKAP